MVEVLQRSPLEEPSKLSSTGSIRSAIARWCASTRRRDPEAASWASRILHVGQTERRRIGQDVIEQPAEIDSHGRDAEPYFQGVQFARSAAC